MPVDFSWDRRVEFCETDAAGIAHFSSLILYMEQAEHALLRALGFSVALSVTSQSTSMAGHEFLSWPRVHLECNFKSPARFEDRLTILVNVASISSKSVSYRHRILLEQCLVADGTMTSVCCTKHGHGLASRDIPLEMRQALRQFLIEQ
jgi:acyl-CoA thioester hydrolase